VGATLAQTATLFGHIAPIHAHPPRRYQRRGVRFRHLDRAVGRHAAVDPGKQLSRADAGRGAQPRRGACRLGLWPRHQAGNETEARCDFRCRGGISSGVPTG
jgi:hypothetical protein